MPSHSQSTPSTQHIFSKVRPWRVYTTSWRKKPKNFFSTVKLFCFCLVPNHIHLLVKQAELQAIKELCSPFLRATACILTNDTNEQEASFKTATKGARLRDEPYLLALSRYIHRNGLSYAKDLTHAYSSYPYYLGLKHAPWIDTTTILSYFQSDPVTKTKHKDYRSFVEWDKEDASLDSTLTLEDEEE